jgi:thiol-disulfide isomerase/thioredoxin
MRFKKLVILVVGLLLISCTNTKEDSFSISGKVLQTKNSYVILATIDDVHKNTISVIDTLAINKKGEFNSVYFLDPAIYTLNFDDEKTVVLAIDKGQHIRLTGNSINNILIKGSEDTDLLNAYEAFRLTSLNTLVKSIRNQIKEAEHVKSEAEIAELRALEVENYQLHINELTKFIKEKMGTSIAIYPTSLRWSGTENLSFYKDLTTAFEKKYPTLQITSKLKERIQILDKTTIGSTITSIKMKNNTGIFIELDSIKKKYTLIDFWASWCPPCRTESNLLNQMYETYHKHGFEIYGISLDSNKERWEHALIKDRRVWPNVSSLEGFNTPIALEYGISALPTNYLIDESGQIIATNIHGVKLKEKIEMLFLNNL